MRILRPEVAKEREEKLLRWVIQEFVETRRPIGSELIAKHALPGISSATIRNIMKKLEEEGFLLQPHTSGGRVPTDKAYRFYVDYLSQVQKIAAQERQRIQQEYDDRIAELDRAMLQTSRMLASLSGSAAFVYTGNITDQIVTRLDFIPLAPGHILAVLVTDTGTVRNWPLRTNYNISPSRLRVLSSFINEQVAGKTLKEAERVLWEHLEKEHNEFTGVMDLARHVLAEIGQQENSSELYLEGLGQLLAETTDVDHESLRQMIKVVEERETFVHMLEDKMNELKASDKKLSVSIGSENHIKEFKDLSVITSAYKVGDKTIGMLGIIGPKHMEYTRMISLVDFIGNLLEGTINNWGTLPGSTEDDLDEET
ncbi:heat-inducible transcriptional repressor [Elusimicrobium simillimum]|uniref:heat-inducible transcriptional repressor HrcA n=1 Tax=Elusimicrobium simillimum TaxID=3143438 RepID=UPI003C70358F